MWEQATSDSSEDQLTSANTAAAEAPAVTSASDSGAVGGGAIGAVSDLFGKMYGDDAGSGYTESFRPQLGGSDAYLPDGQQQIQNAADDLDRRRTFDPAATAALMAMGARGI
jgi:hypothetical protein